MDMTKQFLTHAFIGESEASSKYSAFADIADKEGFTNVSRLFKANSFAEHRHAKHHLEAIGMLGQETSGNLKTAIDSEHQENSKMYPAYLEVAKLEHADYAIETLTHAMQAEKVHEKLYKEAIDAVRNGRDVEFKEIYTCTHCGNTIVNSRISTCPICKHSKFVHF